MAEGVVLEVGGLRARLDADGAWSVDGQPDWAETEAIRLVAASFEDGSRLAVAAVRPVGSAGHDAEAVAGTLVGPDGDERSLAEVLLSTEFGPRGRPRRLGMELYEEEGTIPHRLAADIEKGGGERMALRCRLDGTSGHGTFEVRTAQGD
jgi:hypothetical protein